MRDASKILNDKDDSVINSPCDVQQECNLPPTPDSLLVPLRPCAPLPPATLEALPLPALPVEARAILRQPHSPPPPVAQSDQQRQKMDPALLLSLGVGSSASYDSYAGVSGPVLGYFSELARNAAYDSVRPLVPVRCAKEKQPC